MFGQKLGSWAVLHEEIYTADPKTDAAVSDKRIVVVKGLVRMNLIDLIAKRLSEIFPNITIYSERQKSGFEVPSFYISKIMTITKSRFFDIQDRTVSYSLTYFANPDKPNADIDEVEQKLLNNFTKLDDYATVRNRETTINQDDETLVMSFDLLLNMYKVEDGRKLERIEYNGGI